MTPQWMHRIGLAAAIAVGLFWLWFGIASGIGEHLAPAGVVAHALLPGGILLGILALAWRWPAVGGGLLVVTGIAAGVAARWWAAFPAGVRLAMLALLVAPPIVAGLLLLSAWHRSRPRTP